MHAWPAGQGCVMHLTQARCRARGAGLVPLSALEPRPLASVLRTRQDAVAARVAAAVEPRPLASVLRTRQDAVAAGVAAAVEPRPLASVLRTRRDAVAAGVAMARGGSRVSRAWGSARARPASSPADRRRL